MHEAGRNCSTVQYFNVKANQLPQVLKLNKIASELNGIDTVIPATPAPPAYVNFPNVGVKERSHLNALARSEHSADRAIVVSHIEEIDKERKLVISSISEDMSPDFAFTAQSMIQLDIYDILHRQLQFFVSFSK